MRFIMVNELWLFLSVCDIVSVCDGVMCGVVWLIG